MTNPGGRAPGTLEEPQVRAMFDRIASCYDVMNSVMTAGLHHRWRARAADLAAVGPGDRALDVATGTGDLAVELARRVGPGGEEHEQRPQPLAAGGDRRARVAGEDRPVAVGQRAEALLDAREQARDVVAGGADDLGDGTGDRH